MSIAKAVSVRQKNLYFIIVWKPDSLLYFASDSTLIRKLGGGPIVDVRCIS